MKRTNLLVIVLLLLGLNACGGGASEPVVSEPAPVPTEPRVEASVVPTVTIAPTEEVVEEVMEDDVIEETAVSNPEFEPVPIGEAGKVKFFEMTIGDTTIEYAIALPQNFVPGNTYPVLLAMPPGAQTGSMVRAGLDMLWDEAVKLDDWVVVSPAAPQEQLYFKGSEALIPEFLDRVAATYPPEGGKFHMAGISNGGRSIFRIALNHPERVHSLIAIPGYPPTEDDFAKLDSLTDIPVALFVGERDGETWLEEMERTYQALQEMGGQVTFVVAEDEGHVIRSIRGKDMFELLEGFR